MDTEQHLQTLQNELNVQNEKMLHMEAMITELSTRSATVVAPTPSRKEPELKVSKPPTFKGESTKSYIIFLRSVLLEFSSKPTLFDPTLNANADNNRITFALSFMTEGHAAEWAETRFRECETDAKFKDTWATFKAKMDEAFESSTARSDAQYEMNKLRMISSEPADHYITRFEVLEQRTGYNDVALLEKFKKGLPVAMADEVANTRPEATLKAWKEGTRDISVRWRERQAEKKQFDQIRPTTSITPSRFTTTNYTPRRPIASTSNAQAAAPTRDYRDGTGTTFGGQGQPMNLDRAQKRALGL